MKKTIACLIVSIALAGIAGISAIRAPFLEADSGLEMTRAIGAGQRTMLASNVNSGGRFYVGELTVTGGDSLQTVPGSVTVSEGPEISNLVALPSCNPSICPGQGAQLIELRFDFSDANGDILGGYRNLGYVVNVGTLWVGGGETHILFPPKPYMTVVFDTPTTGHVIMDSCWGGIDDGDLDIELVDAGENASATLGVYVDFPLCTEGASSFVGKVPHFKLLQNSR